MRAKSLQLCLTLCDPHRLQPTRLFCPWGSAGKNTGVGCHALSNIFEEGHLYSLHLENKFISGCWSFLGFLGS